MGNIKKDLKCRKWCKRESKKTLLFTVKNLLIFRHEKLMWYDQLINVFTCAYFLL
jgi:hypothetical protein